jgi:hypothetical protein
VRQHGFDVEDLPCKPNVGDQSVFVASNVKNNQFTNPVDGVERGLEFGSVVEPVFLNHPPPSLQCSVRVRVLYGERSKGAVADDLHVL